MSHGRRLVSLVPVLAALSLLPGAARAQGSAPTTHAGQWGAEAGIGSGNTATLLRFSSPSRAWLLGFDGSFAHDKQELSGVTDENALTRWNVTARAGMRSYRGGDSALRPFTSVGLLAGVGHAESGNLDSNQWMAGAFFELGGSWFFNPHASLGASGQLTGAYQHVKQELTAPAGATGTVNSWTVSLGQIRVLAAVYF